MKLNKTIRNQVREILSVGPNGETKVDQILDLFKEDRGNLIDQIQEMGYSSDHFKLGSGKNRMYICVDSQELEDLKKT